mgnify:CR=1 FL=1
MKKIIATLLFIVIQLQNVQAHDVNYSKMVIRNWHLNNHLTIEGSFSFNKKDEIYLEDINNNIVHFPLSAFCTSDQKILFNNTECKSILCDNMSIITEWNMGDRKYNSYEINYNETTKWIFQKLKLES